MLLAYNKEGRKLSRSATCIDRESFSNKESLKTSRNGSQSDLSINMGTSDE